MLMLKIRLKKFLSLFNTTPLHIALKTENLNMIVILMKHNANPSLQNKDNQTPLELAEGKNRLDILEVLKGNSPLLQYSDENLAQGSPKDRIEDIEDLKDIEIPEQTSPTDPYSRYKNPEKVLKKLGRSSFEELPEHLNFNVLQKLQEQEKFKPKVKEVKSKRLTPAERKKKKWTVTTAGEEQKRMQEMRAKNQNEEIDTDSLLEEAEQAALKEQEENRLKGQKKKKGPTTTPAPPPSNPKSTPKKDDDIPKEEIPKKPEPVKPVENKEEKQNTKQKKTETPKSKAPETSPSEAPKKPQPQNRGKKIKKDLKRVQSSSSDDESNNENDDDDDEIIVMPSFQNKAQQPKQQPPQQQIQPPSSSPPISQNVPQQNQSTSQPSQTEQSSISLDQLKKLMDGYLSERQTQQPQQTPQPPLQYALPPGAYVVPAPGMLPQIAIPTMPQMQPYNPMQAYVGVGGIPSMKVGGIHQMGQIQQPSGMNVTQNEMQRLEARIASLEHIIGPAMRQFNINPNGVQLNTCQNCKTLNAASVCPKCGIQLCNGCRDIHNNQRCK